jgi:hydroxymethylbilane synthase
MRVGTRGSALALAQTQLVADLLGGAEIVAITTTGDRDSAAEAADAIGTAGAMGTAGATGASEDDKSRWVRELEDALLAGEIDLAVHSAKDVPGELAQGLSLLGAPARAAPQDVLCGAGGLDELAHGARVGTSSIRRAAQLLALRADLKLTPVRGNVDTRLRKLAEGSHDAIVLARAGLQRLGREREVGAVLDPERFVPSPGQGVLALQGRAGDERAEAAARAITDSETFACLRAERALALALEAGCHTPLGAHAESGEDGAILLRAWVGLPDGSEWISDRLLGRREDPEALGHGLAARMRSVGAAELLSRAEEMVTA